jgi:transcriptional regulator with XRE-family HTH domain
VTEQSTTPKPFGQRVKELLEQKKVSQAELADRADIPAPTLSKLLSDQRDLRLEHVFSLARALGTTPTELAYGTSAEGLVDEWVPRSQAESEARARVEAQQDLAKLRTEMESQLAKITALESSGKEMRDRIASVTGEAQKAQADLAAARAQTTILTRERDEAMGRAKEKAMALMNANLRVQSLAAQLAKVEGDQVGKAVVTGLLSFLGGVLVSGKGEAPRSSSGRRSASGRSRRR